MSRTFASLVLGLTSLMASGSARSAPDEQPAPWRFGDLKLAQAPVAIDPLKLVRPTARVEATTSIASAPSTSSQAGIALTPQLAVPALPPAAATVAAVSAMTGLQLRLPNVVNTAAWVVPTPTCNLGVSLPDSLKPLSPVALPNDDGGLLFTPQERSTWTQRSFQGPFREPGDYAPRSPGDWRRIVENTDRFLSSGEPAPTAADNGATRSTLGTLARDAAFHHLITGTPRSLAAVRSYLVAQAGNPNNDFSRLCIVLGDGTTLDARFWHASWLLRYIVTYDFVRSELNEAERSAIEHAIRRNAYALAAHIDWGNARLFPNRLYGDYRARASDANVTAEGDVWWAKRFNLSGDCRGTPDPRSERLPVYAYSHSDGSPGPRITALSQWFNNRKSTAAAAFGLAGAMLGDEVLVASAKRYFMEWLTYAVWPDGSEGEFARNGDYCIAQQGVIYATTNLQAGLLMARVLSRQGDASLAQFQTAQGLYGTESLGEQPRKSLALVSQTHVALRLGQLPWFFHEPWRGTQWPRAGTFLGAATSRYLGSTTTTDNYHELGILMAAHLVPGVPIRGLVLRDPSVSTLPFPGAYGNPVATGSGQWTDVFNALPAVLLIRP